VMLLVAVWAVVPVERTATQNAQQNQPICCVDGTMAGSGRSRSFATAAVFFLQEGTCRSSRCPN
jgi:hypothetical protein